MMVLVAVAVGAGWLYSVAITVTGGGEVFYEAASVLTAFVLLGRDIETVFRVSDPFREKAIRLCNRASEAARHMPSPQYILHSVYTLKWLLSLHKDPYVMAFSVLSALYRC